MTTCYRRPLLPTPPHTFVSVQPNTWFTALSAQRRDWNECGNMTLRLSAWFANVLLEVLLERKGNFAASLVR